MLNRHQSIHHLLRLGLLTAEELIDGSWRATEFVSRNHIVRVENGGGAGFSIKRPRDAAQPDAMTMWTEAAMFWLSANDPAFAPLARWMPRYFHYDEAQKILTIEFVAPAASLAEKLFAAGVPPVLAAEAGRAFATLHGPVSAAADESSRRLFSTLAPWALTLGFPDDRYRPPSPAAAAVLGEVMRHREAMAGLIRLRRLWQPARIIHGDAKAANILILDDGSIRIIDWEIAALGDPLWDVAGFLHSLLIPNPASAAEALAAAQARARPLAEGFWAGYRAVAVPLGGGDPRDTMLRMTGARIVQTCLESAHSGAYAAGLPGMLDMAMELIARPAAAIARWEWGP